MKATEQHLVPNNTTGSESHKQQQGFDSPLITLTEATKIAPGRPSTNCLWRWCRRGVISRGGERIRLQHRRIGGKIFTALSWLEEFGRQLAEADTRYFDLCQAAAAEAARAEPRIPRRRSRPDRQNKIDAGLRDAEIAEQELDRAGIK